MSIFAKPLKKKRIHLIDQRAEQCSYAMNIFGSGEYLFGNLNTAVKVKDTKAHLGTSEFGFSQIAAHGRSILFPLYFLKIFCPNVNSTKGRRVLMQDRDRVYALRCGHPNGSIYRRR